MNPALIIDGVLIKITTKDTKQDTKLTEFLANNLVPRPKRRITKAWDK